MQRLGTALCLVLLAGCQDQAPSAKAVIAEGGKLAKPLPGLYRTTTSLTSFDLPGADPNTEDMMRDRFAQVLPQTREFCLTPAAAARGFEDMVRQSQQGDCIIERFVANSSRLSARMSCRAGDRLTSTVSIEGTGEATRSTVELNIVQAGPSVPGGTEKIAMQVDNERIGDCPKRNRTAAS